MAATEPHPGDPGLRPPRPVDPGPAGSTPTVGEATRARLREADRRREAEAAAQEDVTRQAIGFGVGITALAVAWRLLGPGRQ